MSKTFAGFKKSYWACLSLLVLSLLLVDLQPSRVSAAGSPRLELSRTSGPTGTVLTVKGFDLQNQTGCNFAGLFLRESSTSLAALQIGATSIRDDGSFVWTGPLPRAGKRVYAENETEYVVPKQKLSVYFGVLQGACPSAQADFTVTDNAIGPYVGDTSFDIRAILGLWLHTDQLVGNGTVSRSWLWGPLTQGAGVTSFMEEYKEAPHGWRAVTYFDKSRMEITKPDAKQDDPYYITNGLLVKELVSGQVQTGDSSFKDNGTPTNSVAGDLTPDSTCPRFSEFRTLLDRSDIDVEGTTILQTLSRSARSGPQSAPILVGSDSNLGTYGVKAAHLVMETHHFVASPFWSYLNSSGKILGKDGKTTDGRLFDPVFYATGLPITEAYWTKTPIAGKSQDVLVQLFERRVLTYTPSNPPAYQIEMGNVGAVYYQWRYAAQ